jgi:hypothetical protein
MSSSRSVAAARQRRSVDQSAQPQQTRGPQQSIASQQLFAQQQQRTSYANFQQAQGQMQQPQTQSQQRSSYAQQGQNQMQKQQQNLQTPQSNFEKKEIQSLTVNQAITLITLRLGRLESGLAKIHHEGVPVSHEGLEGDENLRLIDETVLNNILTRLQTIENSKATTNNSSNNNSSFVADLTNQISVLQTELKDAKEAISKLQLFTMETNQKLLNVVFQQSSQSTSAVSNSSLGGADVDVEVESVDDTDLGDETEDVVEDGETPTTNLKELIQRELENEDN